MIFKLEVKYEMGNRDLDRGIKTYIQSMKTVVLVSIILTSILGCKRTITGPKPPSGDNEIEYPFNVSDNTTQSYQPQIAIDGDGNIHILWMDGGATEYEKSYIYHRVYSPESGIWSNIDTISDTLGDCWIGGAVSDIYGNIHVVWLEYKSDGSHTYYRELYSGGYWSDIVELTDTQDADQPVIAADSMGGVHVMWNSYHGYLYKYKGSGGVWQWRDTLGTTMVNPSLYAKPDGSLIMVLSPWYDVSYYEHPFGGRWSSEEVVDTSGLHVNSWLGAAYYDEEEERTIVVWSEGYTRMMYRYKYNNGQWSEPHYVYAQGTSDMPRVKKVFKHDGRTYLIWGDGIFRLYMGIAPDELSDTNMKVKLIEDPGAPYFDCILDSNGTIHLVWACEGPDSREDNDVYYTEIQLAR